MKNVLTFKFFLPIEKRRKRIWKKFFLDHNLNLFRHPPLLLSLSHHHHPLSLLEALISGRLQPLMMLKKWINGRESGLLLSIILNQFSNNIIPLLPPFLQRLLVLLYSMLPRRLLLFWMKAIFLPLLRLLFAR